MNYNPSLADIAISYGIGREGYPLNLITITYTDELRGTNNYYTTLHYTTT